MTESESSAGSDKTLIREALIDATEQIMRTEGYAAVSTRRIAAKVGVKGPTIHYYFKTVDNLYIAVYRRIAEAGIRQLEALLHSDAPFRQLIAHANSPEAVKLTMEFISLSHHRPAIREVIAHFADQGRTLQTEIVKAYFDKHRIKSPIPLETVPILLSGVSYLLSLDLSIGASVGHAETRNLFDTILSELEEKKSFAI